MAASGWSGAAARPFASWTFLYRTKQETRLHPYLLSPFDEDAEINPSLIYMLRKDFEFAAPEFDLEPDAESLQKFFERLGRSVKGRGWRVLQEGLAEPISVLESWRCTKILRSIP